MKVLQEGPLANFLNRLMNLILLNALWILCSLPLFTLGAATCAVYEVTMSYAFSEDPSLISTFFHAFRRNFKKATILFLLFFIAGLFMLFDFWCALQWDTAFRYVPIVIILSVFYFYLAVLSHVFPVLSYFNTGVKESIRKAFILSMRNGIFTIFIMVMNVLPILAIIKFPGYIEAIIFLYFVFGVSGIAMLNSFHLAQLFDPERVKENSLN